MSGPTFEPKHVLVDGDIVAYRAGFASEGKTSADAEDKVDEVMNFIASNTMSFPVPDRFHTFLKMLLQYQITISLKNVKMLTL